MRPRTLRLLLIEDRADDAELILEHLREAGLDPEWDRVDDEPSYRAKLTAGFDLILADFSLPQFDALRALEILKESRLDIPFIIVSGRISDNAAVDSMRAGASDYLFKDNLSRLAAAVTRELDAADQRKAGARAREESAARLGAIIRSALDAVVSMDTAGSWAGTLRPRPCSAGRRTKRSAGSWRTPSFHLPCGRLTLSVWRATSPAANSMF